MKTIVTCRFSEKSSKSFSAFLKEASKQPRLSANEQAELVQSYQSNPNSQEGMEAREKLVLCNLLFVVKIAKDYLFRTNLPLEDLISEGCIGLIKAAQLYRPQENATFLSYAVNWIRQNIQLFIDKNNLNVRLPQNQLALIRKIEKAKREFERVYYYEPDVYDLADLIDETEKHISDAMLATSGRVALDRPIYEDEDGSDSISDTVSINYYVNDDEMYDESRSVEIREALKEMLSPRDQEIVKFYFGLFGYEEKTLTQISEMFEISDERARQIVKKAIRELRNVGNLYAYCA